MTAAQKHDELVAQVTCHNARPVLLHTYIAPFIVAYAALIYAWFDRYSANEEHREPWYVASAVVILLQALCYLSAQWSVNLNALFAYKKVKPEEAQYAKVIPTPNNGSTEICLLQRDSPAQDDERKLPQIWFMFQKAKYIYDYDQETFLPVQYPVNLTVQEYLNSRGFTKSSQTEEARKLYGLNDLHMDVPKFWELFRERAIAPFFVFQVFCMVLWLSEEYWYYSLFTLSMLILFEAFLVQQQLRNLTEIRKMGNHEPYKVSTYRESKWIQVLSNELFPGDLIAIGRSQNHMVPCDLLLLSGSLIVDEAMLTGESVPQMKESISSTDNYNRKLDLNVDGKLHILFGGTKILQSQGAIDGNTKITIKTGTNACLGYVLKTSFNTSQGKLLRTILFGVKHVTANTLETFFFILFLLVFAIASASYLWIEGSKDPRRSRYKLMLECIFILTSVVPPELPIELSLAVNASLLSLTGLYIYCTEPFRIPFAGKTEICCFDKTGTLTSDSLKFEGVVGVDNKNFKKLSPASSLPIETVQVLATCHSLVQLDEGVIGDPLEKATLNGIEWQVIKNDVVSPKKGRAVALRILSRFHFSSALKRMAVIASYTDSTTKEIRNIVTVKGAPEVIKGMLSNVPAEYDAAYLAISRKGGRVIALARKDLNEISPLNLKQLKRENVEEGLTFAGFAVISSPLKEDTKKVMKEILDSSHAVMMITGDAPLTACYIASELDMLRKHKTTLILTEVENDKGVWEHVWMPISEDVVLPLKPKDINSFLTTFDLCITGEGLAHLLNKHHDLFKKLLPHVRVWARVAPKQKELIITSLRGEGYYTLMCGDGTNDVGALKHAHVGIALISNAPLQAPTKKQQEKKQDAISKIRQLQQAQQQMLQTSRTQPMTAQERNQLCAQQMRKLMEDLEAENLMVKLGDASIAAPFTSRLGSIKCVCDVIKQGRCTLVTTLQMFKILAINSLILAYCQSALYLDGIKFSDSQATLQGVMLASCFLFISRSKPLKTLSSKRPLPNIFNAYSLLTVTSQFAVHFASLIFLVTQAKARMPVKEDNYVDLEAEFKPSILNSTVYIISIALQVSTFTVNYKGYPFMERLRDNSSLLFSIIGSMGVLLCVITGAVDGLADKFSIVPFEPDYQILLLCTLAFDFVCAFLVDRIWQYLLGYGKLNSALL